MYFCFIGYPQAFDCVNHNKLWKILKVMGISDHLTCLLRNLYASQEATVRTRHGITDWLKIELSNSTTNSLRANLRRSKVTDLPKYVIAWCSWRVIRLKWLFIIEDL